MATSSPHEVTQLLLDWRNGDQEALDKLTPLIYDELRRLAESYLRREKAAHTLQATALVNEAFLRLIGSHQIDWQNRAHFFGLAAQIMRHILVDHARLRCRARRGGGAQNLPLEEAASLAEERAAELIALDDALEGLAKVDARKSRIIELRYFAGLGVEETAEVMRLSVATIRRDLRMAEAWLYREISRTAASE